MPELMEINSQTTSKCNFRKYMPIFLFEEIANSSYLFQMYYLLANFVDNLPGFLQNT